MTAVSPPLSTTSRPGYVSGARPAPWTRTEIVAAPCPAMSLAGLWNPHTCLALSLYLSSVMLLVWLERSPVVRV
jgi:hypothetical protein